MAKGKKMKDNPNQKGPWTQFWDMHSGGGQKLEWAMIYIQAPEAEAAVIFQNLFGRNPNRVSCTCCGEDYSLSESADLSQATAYQRGCAYGYFRPDGTECGEKEAFVIGKGLKRGYKSGWVERPDTRYAAKKHIPLKEYIKQKDVKIVYAEEIKAEDRKGTLREEGYVWRG